MQYKPGQKVKILQGSDVPGLVWMSSMNELYSTT